MDWHALVANMTSIFSHSPTTAYSGMDQVILWEVRLPRILAALSIGCGLAVAGVVYQGVFRNPMVSPDVLGVSSGAGLGAVLGLLFDTSTGIMQALAFTGGMLAVGLVILIARAARYKQETVLMLLLAGIIVSAFFGACIALAKLVADPTGKLPAITFWLMGSLGSVTWSDLVYLLPVTLIGCAWLYVLRWKIDLLALGEVNAKALGVSTNLIRWQCIAAATLISASVAAVAGMIGWIGLVVPHLARLIVGPSHLRSIPVAALLGATLLLLIDTLARSAVAQEIPLGILTAIVGAPTFLVVLLRQRSAA